MAGAIAGTGGGTIAAVEADPSALPSQPERPGILDLYRSVADALIPAVGRRRLGLAAEGVAIGAYVGLRTIGASDDVLHLWLVLIVAGAIVSPTFGLVVLAAIAPLNEGIGLTRDLGSKTVLAAATGLGIVLRLLLDRGARFRPPAPVILTGGLFVTSGLGLVISWQRWGTAFAESAAEIWLQGVGTMLIVFAAATWVARNGSRRPLVVAIAASVVAGLISLVDFSGDAALRDGPLGWLVVGAFNPDRLTGVIRSPTSTAALIMVPLCILIVAAILGWDPRIRIGSALVAIPLVVAAYLTYNRAVFLGLWLTAVVVAWRIRRALGVAFLVGGLALGAALLPSYLALRGQAVGAGSQLAPGQILIASDQQRLTAWATAGRMFLDQPILGQGYRAYRQLSIQFGDPTLNAPHNEWLRFFAEGGIVTGSLALLFVVATIVLMARRTGWLETGLLASFVAFCLAAAFNNPFLFNQVTIPAMLAAGTGIGLAVRPPADTEAHA